MAQLWTLWGDGREGLGSDQTSHPSSHPASDLLGSETTLRPELHQPHRASGALDKKNLTHTLLEGISGTEAQGLVSYGMDVVRGPRKRIHLFDEEESDVEGLEVESCLDGQAESQLLTLVDQSQ